MQQLLAEAQALVQFAFRWYAVARQLALAEAAQQALEQVQLLANLALLLNNARLAAQLAKALRAVERRRVV